MVPPLAGQIDEREALNLTPVLIMWARLAEPLGPANRCAESARASLNDYLDEVAGFQSLVRLEAVQYLKPFDLMIERRHPG
jgi:hypothetical protein